MFNRAMKIIIGLGNPGKKYCMHRHNIGFQTLDVYADTHALHFAEKAIFNAEVAIDGELSLAKPTTWMNDSGTAAKALTKQFDAPLVVIYDDIDINVGTVKCSFDRGSGGHNGVQSVIDHLGTKEFFRIRIGVRPTHEELLPRIAPPDGFEKYLLSDFAPFEEEKKKDGINRAIEIIEALKTMTFEEIMNKYN